MASDVDIVNRALQRIGSRRIGTLATDTSREGIESRTMYSLVRNAELRMNCWRFSIRRISLDALVATPAFGRTSQYQLPPDYLRKCPLDPTVKPLKDDVLFEEDKILTDDPGPFLLRYVSKDVDPTRYDPLFVEALSARLAMELAPILVQADASTMDRIENSYIFHINTARRVNAIELGSAETEVVEGVATRSR